MDTELQDNGFRLFQKGAYYNLGKFTLQPNSSQEVLVMFEPFEFYPGYSYAIKAVIWVNDKKYEAVSNIKIIRSHRRDKNWFKSKVEQ